MLADPGWSASSRRCWPRWRSCRAFRRCRCRAAAARRSGARADAPATTRGPAREKGNRRSCCLGEACVARRRRDPRTRAGRASAWRCRIAAPATRRCRMAGRCARRGAGFARRRGCRPVAARRRGRESLRGLAVSPRATRTVSACRRHARCSTISTPPTRRSCARSPSCPARRRRRGAAAAVAEGVACGRCTRSSKRSARRWRQRQARRPVLAEREAR